MNESTLNNSIADIREKYDVLELARENFRESCRNYLSRFLTDTSENKPYECDILVDFGAFGLSTLQLPHIDRMWQHPTEGVIYFHFEKVDCIVEFDQIFDSELLPIIEGLI